MLSSALLASGAKFFLNSAMRLGQATVVNLPLPNINSKNGLLYIHIPFCETLCPYCSFNRYEYDKSAATAYFAALLAEITAYAKAGYEFSSIYIGGGTPTISLTELANLIDECKRLFPIKEISCETNPNHLNSQTAEALHSRVNRLSVGIQSFDSSLLAKMGRLAKYGNEDTILAGLAAVKPAFECLNADMIFNFPQQTSKMLQHDIATIYNSAASQTTFYPLMASPSVKKSLANSLGRVNYTQEMEFYQQICSGLTRENTANEKLAQSAQTSFDFGSAWTFNRSSSKAIDEYVIENDEYVACGAGGFGISGGQLLVNAFKVDDYIKRVEQNGNSIAFAKTFTKRQVSDYSLLMRVFGLGINRTGWFKAFGKYPEQSSPLFFGYLEQAGAFVSTSHVSSSNDLSCASNSTGNEQADDTIRLTEKGRYLAVVLMREFFISVNRLRDAARA